MHTLFDGHQVVASLLLAGLNNAADELEQTQWGQLSVNCLKVAQYGLVESLGEETYQHQKFRRKYVSDTWLLYLTILNL